MTYENNSFYYKYKNNNKYKILVTTSRKFKGLESPAVILIDVAPKYIKKNDSQDNVIPNEENIYYVATSRAKLDLAIIFNMSIDEINKFSGSNSLKVERNKKKIIKDLDGVIFTKINGEQLL